MAFLEDIETEQLAEDAIEVVWSSFEAALLTNLISEIEIPIAAEQAMQKIYKMIALSICSHDGDMTGHPVHLEVLTADTEPLLAVLDPWARGTVQTKKAVIQDDSSFRGTTETNTAPSVGSHRSRRSSRQGMTVSSVGRSERSNATRNKVSAAEDIGSTWNLDDGDPDADYDNLNMTGYMFDMLQKSKRQKHKDPVTQVEIKDEFEVLEEAIKQSAKDLKTERFTVDKHGNVIPLQPVRPEALPPFAVPLELSIASTSVATMSSKNAAAAAASTNNNNETTVGKKKKKVVRVAGSRSIDDMFFKPANNLSTSLAGGEYITQLNPGVAIRVDDAVREGPPVPEDPKKISRRAYLERSTALHNSLSGESFSSSVMSKSLARNESLDSLNKDNNNTMMSQSLLTMKFPDVDIFQGSRRAKPSELPAMTSADDDSSVRLKKPTAGRLIAATVIPVKASDKQAENLNQLQGGADKPRPRDRDMPISMVPPSERKKLPAPPLGKTTGHGFSPEKSKTAAISNASVISNMSSAANSVSSFRGRK